MNILLTGATGYLGSHLLKRLLGDHHQVTVLARSTSSLQRIATHLNRITVHTIGGTSLHELFSNSRIETIIHCATNYGLGQVDPSELVESNLTMPLKLLQAGCDAGVRCFVNADTILDRNVSAYALSKSQFREWLGTYSQKMCCVNVALEHFYGPHDDASKFVSYIVKQLLDKAESINLTLGEQKRDFTYIDDVVSAFIMILANCDQLKSGNSNFQVGSGQNITIRDFVELIKQLTGNTHTQLNFGSVAYRENEPMETDVDTSAICALGWKPETTFIEGLSKMIAQEQEQRTR